MSSSAPKERFQKKPKVADFSQTMPPAAARSTKSLYCCRSYLCFCLPRGPSGASVYLCSALRSCQKMRAPAPFWLQVNTQLYFERRQESSSRLTNVAVHFSCVFYCISFFYSGFLCNGHDFSIIFHDDLMEIFKNTETRRDIFRPVT